MEAPDNILSVTPVSCLSTIFSIFRVISQTVQQTQTSREQLGALAQIIAQLLQILDRGYQDRQLSVRATATPLEILRKLLEEISVFIQKESTRPFLQSLLTQTERIAEIGGYHHQVESLVTAFKLSNVLNTNQWQSKMERGLMKDQQLLNNRLCYLETDQQQLFELLDIPASETAIMVCLQRRLDSGFDSDRKRQFFRYVLQLLIASHGCGVDVEDWMITPYEVEFGSRIGFGGFGEVYKGVWNKIQVAIKVFRTESGLIPSPMAIRREIETWSALRHTHVLQFLGANELDGRPFIVMPYLQNGNVRDYIRTCPGCNRLQIIHHICLGLVYLHSLTIIHGDLKGLNVLIDDGGNGVLCDFGLSRIKSDTTSHTARLSTVSADCIVGSRNWMAPELLVGRTLRKPCDIYALGMTIYEVFTNDVPLGNVAYADFIELVVRQDVRPERPDDEEAPTLSDAIWEVAEKCWVKDPKQRPTASAMCDVVSSLLGPNVPPTPSNPQLRVHTARARPATPMSLSANRMVRAAPTSSTPEWSVHTARTRRSVPAIPSVEIMRTAGPRSTIGEVERTRRGDPLLPLSSSDSVALPQVEVKEILILGPQLELRGHSRQVWAVAFSHDGRSIVSGSDDGTLRVWDVQTGGLNIGPLTQNGMRAFRSVTFSFDGAQVASGSNTGDVTIWDLHTGKASVTPFRGQTGWVYRVAFSPDGKLMASTSTEKIVVWETRGGRKIIEHAGFFEFHMGFSPDGKHLLCKRGESINVWDVLAVRVVLQFPVHGRISYLAFSADGTRIIYGDENGDFRTWDAVTGAAIVKIPSKRHRPGTLAVGPLSSTKPWVDISPDGKWIVTRCGLSDCVLNHKHGVQVWNSATGELAITFAHEHLLADWVAFLPNSKQIAYTAALRADPNIYIQTLNFISVT